MASLVGNNAIGWAQFQLNGGWKNTLGVLGAYAVIVGGVIAVTASIDARQTTAILSWWTKGLLGLQLAILAIYGSNRIIAGIRRDITGLMIESNRLMPVPPLHAVVGYIFGAASQAISLALVNFILGAVATKRAGLPMDFWVKAHLVIATFTVFIWTVVAVAALSARGALFWIVGPMVGFWFSGGALALLVPGLSVLATPTQGPSVFDARIGSREPALYAAPLMCQGVIGVICVAAAVRKYRRSEDAAFDPLLALAMLAAVVLTGVYGIRWFDEVAPRYLGGEGDVDVQLVASTIVVMWFVAAAMCAVAWAEAVANRPLAREGGHRPPRTLHPLAGAVLGAGIGTALMLAVPERWEDRRFLAYIGGIMLVHALAVTHLARWCYRRVDRAAGIVIIWLALTWLAPLVLDLVLRAFSDADHETDMGTLAAWSPIGCLIALVNPGEANPRIGLIGQAVLASLPMLLYYLERLRTRPRAAEPIAAAPAPAP